LEWNQLQKEQDKSVAHLVSAQSIAHSTSVDWDLRPIREKGEVRTMHDCFEEICDGAGTPVELIGATKDINEYRK
jgi:hypothetical protein